MKKLKKALVIMLAICLTLSQGVFVQAAGKKAPKYQITMNKTVYTMKKGKTIVLKSTLNKAAKKKKVEWSSSKKSVATVSSRGKVTAKKNGKTTVTARIKGTSAKAVCKITVGAPVTKIKLAKSSINTKVGVYTKLEMKFSPTKPSNTKVTYKSSDSSVVTVNASGVIKAVKAGEAKITVKAADGSGKSASCKVNVAAGNSQKPDTETPDTEKPTPDPEKPAPDPEKPTPDPEKPAPDTEKPAPDTEEPDTEVEVLRVTLNKSEISLKTEQEEKLTASIEPENADNKEITWQTSDSEIVTVDKGTVKALKAGKATVTATAANGKSAACEVKVIALSEGNAGTPEELDQALSDDELKKIFYESDTDEDIEISAGDYTDKTLEINAPNTDVTNNGTFEKVVVQAISNTYVENAENTIDYNADNGKIAVGSSGIATISLSEAGGQNLHIDNKGKINNLNIPARTSLRMEGTNAVPVTLAKEAEGTDIKTSVDIDVTSSAKWEMSILPGAEHTRAAVDSRACMPSVYGIGCIPVTVNAENDIVNVSAEMRSDLESEITKRVSITGKIQEYKLNTETGRLDKKDSSDAQIYLIPYNSENLGADLEDAGFIQGMTPTGVANATGDYTLTDVRIGNYWMLATKDGFKTAVTNMNITSFNTEVYANTNITLLQSELYPGGNASTISGTVIDGLTGQVLKTPGLQVKLRGGNGNIVGTVYQNVVTDNAGKFTFSNIPVGVYTIEVLDLRELPPDESNYNQASTDIVVVPGYLATDNYNCIINPQMSSGDGQDQVQFTLTWGTEESGASADIDSHLIGPKSNGNGVFHTWYVNKGYYEANEKMADLDVDDMVFEGPEHTTIYNAADGVYRFYVRNYTERQTEESDMLGRSSIQVRVTIGNNVYTYNCPNQSGNLWYVCDFDSRSRSIIAKNVVTSYVNRNTECYVGYTQEEIDAIDLDVEKDVVRAQISDLEEDLSKYIDNEKKTEYMDLMKIYRDGIDSLSDYESLLGYVDGIRDIKNMINAEFCYPILKADGVSDFIFTVGGTGDYFQADCSASEFENFSATTTDGIIEVKTQQESEKEIDLLVTLSSGMAYKLKVRAVGRSGASVSSRIQSCNNLLFTFEDNEAIEAVKAKVGEVNDSIPSVTTETVSARAGEEIDKITDTLQDSIQISGFIAGSNIESWKQYLREEYDDNNQVIGAKDVLEIKCKDTPDGGFLQKSGLTFNKDTVTYTVESIEDQDYQAVIRATDSETGYVKNIYVMKSE